MFGRGRERECRCEATFEGDSLRVDASDCSGEGRLAEEPACRGTVVGTLRERDAAAIHTRAAGVERVYEDGAAALLVSAGRFADAAAFHDEALAERACRYPLAAAAEATGRAGAVARVAAETGLAECAADASGYADALRPAVGPVVASERLTVDPPAAAPLVDRYDLPTDATVRVYEPTADLRTYHLTPVSADLDAGATATLAAAHERLATGEIAGGERAPGRAVRAVAGPDAPVETLATVLEKHTRGFGVLEDLFADDAVSDVFATAPVADNPLRVRVDGEAMCTNVRLTDEGAGALASWLRLDSGRPLSRADPTLDATAEVGDRRVRVAAVTDPLADGHAFVLRAHDRDRFRLPDLVANGTLPPEAAALCSLAVERGAAVLVAGGRGAGKTTLLGALVPELPVGTRTVVVEDTTELPVERLQAAGRDVQRLRVTRDGRATGPTEAVRTALRLGEGALVVGEVRGEEASALYEAMRVGASDAVLGTVHGEDAAAVRERVVSDLGVPASAFADTDLVVTCGLLAGERRVVEITEVVGRETAEFAPLFDVAGEGLTATGRIERGESHLLASLATPDETYADVHRALTDRTGSLMA